MKIICAWCRRVLEDDEGEEGDLVSHSICPECKAKEEKKP